MESGGCVRDEDQKKRIQRGKRTRDKRSSNLYPKFCKGRVQGKNQARGHYRRLIFTK